MCKLTTQSLVSYIFFWGFFFPKSWKWQEKLKKKKSVPANVWLISWLHLLIHKSWHRVYFNECQKKKKRQADIYVQSNPTECFYFLLCCVLPRVLCPPLPRVLCPPPPPCLWFILQRLVTCYLDKRNDKS